MSAGQYAARGPLWAELKRDRDNTISLPLAFLIAAILEIGIFAAVFFVDWTDEYGVQAPPMTVQLVEPEAPKEEPKPEPIKPPEPPPAEPIKEPEPPKPIPKPEPKPIPEVAPPKVEIKPEPTPEPKIIIPEPKPKPEPVPELKAEPPPPQPVPGPKVDAPPPEPAKVEPKVEPQVQAAPPKQVRNAKPLRKVAAAYPRSALKNGTMGKVKARLTIGAGGDVIDVEIMESSPPGVFDDAVTRAVKQYKFQGDGSKYFVDQEVLFKLED